MGDMADMFLGEVFENETRLDSFACGDMDINEAYEYGFVDNNGIIPEFEHAISRMNIYTPETAMVEISRLNLTLSTSPITTIPRRRRYDGEIPKGCEDLEIYHLDRYNHHINEEDPFIPTIAEQDKPAPLCNDCNNSMHVRSGKFGKFYFCKHSCGSPTINFNAWSG